MEINVKLQTELWDPQPPLLGKARLHPLHSLPATTIGGVLSGETAWPKEKALKLVDS